MQQEMKPSPAADRTAKETRTADPGRKAAVRLKTVLTLLTALLVLAAAFLLPGLSLRLQTWAALRTTLREDASDALLDPAPVDLVKKLRLLREAELTVMPIAMEPDHASREELLEIAAREMEILLDLGALDPDLREILDVGPEYWNVEYVFLILPETNLTADVYYLRLWDDLAVLTLDRATGKLLSLSVARGAAPAFAEALDEQSLRRQTAAWAEYYGLELTAYAGPELPLSQLRSRRNPWATVTGAWLSSAAFSDAGGSTVRFGLRYDFYGREEAFAWSPQAEGN